MIFHLLWRTIMPSEPSSPPKPFRSWNKGKFIGPKRPLSPRYVWSIRARLQLDGKIRDLALFNLAIDSKLRGCDLVSLRVDDVAPHGYTASRATVRQRKTGRPVRFEITEQTRQTVDAYFRAQPKMPGHYLFPGRWGQARSLTTRQYARLVSEWIASVGLDPSNYGTHSLRRTKATLIYKKTGNLRAVQLLLETTTNCPATLDRGENPLSLPSALWGDGADRASADPLWRRVGGHCPARRIAGPAPGVDAA